jgi:23S rRNA (cytosine1962-C5)-methyltransferase
LSSSDGARRGISLKQNRDAPVRRRHHPWIYSQAVAEAAPGTSPADLLPVRSADGTVIGWGLYSPDSLIAVRMVSFTSEAPPEDWIVRRIRSAHAMRQRLSLDSDAFRLVNSEGDFLPGCIIDVYGDTVVISPHTRGIESAMDRIASCLASLLPGANIYLKRDEHFARVEKLALPAGYLSGTGDGKVVIHEGGVKILVDFARGQKTGYYLDQRANRSIISGCSAGRSVLNLFSYTGAASLRAAAAGALSVASVDSSRAALDLAAESCALNPRLDPGIFSWVQADVFSYLEDPETCDLVIADPPPFARRRIELDGALKGYLSLFQQCLRILKPGGFGFLFSCSGAVDRPTFQQVVAEAALRSGRTVRLLRELHADADHPISAAHPEGEYLKGWMVHAE